MTEIINALHNDQPTESTHEVMQHRPLPSRFDLRAAKAMNRSKNHKPRAAAVVSAAAAAVLTLSAIAPTPEATLALWNDTLSIYLGVNPDVWIPPTVTEVPPPSVPQDGDRCFYFDDFNSNGIRRPEVKFAFGTPTPGTENTGGDLSKLFESNPSITISYSTTVRNFTNRGGTTANPAPAILFQSVRASAASLATVGTATPSTSTLAGAGIFISVAQ